LKDILKTNLSVFFLKKTNLSSGTFTFVRKKRHPENRGIKNKHSNNIKQKIGSAIRINIHGTQ